MRMMIVVYDRCKYDPESKPAHRVEYDDVTGYEVISDPEAAANIEANTYDSCIDDHHEYLSLHFDSGEILTYRNSYVDLFRI